jgi:hypothetical protein
MLMIVGLAFVFCLVLRITRLSSGVHRNLGVGVLIWPTG